MPYIDQYARMEMIEEMGDYCRIPTTESSGELNYLITSILVNYIINNGLSYQSINDILGALDGASKEFYRRVAVPYEDFKIRQNGDVYGSIHPAASETDEAWTARLKKETV